MKILRPIHLAKLLGVSTSTIWRMEKAGKLPPKYKISDRVVGWRQQDIDQWLESECIIGA